MTEKDKIEQFKRDLRSLSYYESKSRDISDELIRLSRIMHEPKGIRYGERLGGTHLNYLELMSREEELVNELKSYSFLIKTTRDRLNSLSDEEKSLLEQLYIRRKSFTHISVKMAVSERKLKYDVDDIIRKVI